MTNTVEKLSSNKVKISFTVEAERFDVALKAAYNKMNKKISIPGFRKGKAPMKVVENYYGETVFYEDAIDILFPELYREAIETNKLEVVDRPELDVQQIGKGKELKFTVEVFVTPDVELGEYTHLGLVKTVDEVTEDDVNADIERARDRASRWIEVTDRAAQLDDKVTIDYTGYLDGEEFDGGAAENHDLQLGSGAFIPGFEDQIVGKNIGEEFQVNVTFPTEYHAEDLAGKPVVFEVRLNAIRKKEMPALDEDFVKEISETADTVEQYKAEVRARLEKTANDRADADFENQLIEAICENAKVDIPAAMIEEQIDSLMRDMEMRMAYQGLRMEDYLKYTNKTVEAMRDNYRAQAETRVKAQLVIKAITEKEAIAAEEADVEAEIAKYAEQNRKTVEEFKAMLKDGDMKYFSEIATAQKTLDFLKANAE